jgi:transcriptional regulator with GAF, ATPase, and Fis domain
MAISELIGSSARFQAVLEDVQVVAPAECAVLVQGETGRERNDRSRDS